MKQILDIFHIGATESHGLGEGHREKKEDGEDHVSRSGRGAAAKEQPTRQEGNQKHVSWKPSEERASKNRVWLAVPNCQSHWHEGSEVTARFDG